MDFHQFSTNPMIFLGLVFLTINPTQKWHGVFGGFLGVFLKEFFFTQFWANSRNTRIPPKMTQRKIGLGKQYIAQSGYYWSTSTFKSGCQMVPFQGVNSASLRLELAPRLEGAARYFRKPLLHLTFCMDTVSCSPMDPSSCSERT